MTDKDFEALMSEAPDGNDYARGRVEAELYEEDGSHAGFHLVGQGVPFEDGGMVAHRGPVHPDEYIDQDVLRDAAEAALGFTSEEVSSAYPRGGRLSPELRQLRDRIDTRLLALSHAGGLPKLAEIFGLNEKTLDRALARARDRLLDPIVKNPAVTHPRMCFIEGTMDAKPRRRQRQGCPAHMMPMPQYRDGTINLSDRAYYRGL